MTEQLDLEDWLREHPANSDDTDNSLKNNEKWKNEDLEEGNYYIKDKYGNYLIAQYLPDYDYDHQDGYALDGYRWFALGFDYDDFEQDSVEEVLAPVPSYEEWQNINEFADYSIHNRNELTKQINYLFGENEKLSQWNIKAQELLKECRKVFDLHSYRDDLPARIDEVLK